MSRPRKVSVIVLSWNGRQHLEVCLAALRRQQPPGCDWEILVLDNGSTDGTGPWVRRHHPQVRLIVSPVNLGFCAGNNRLVDEAEGDAIVLLNNDTRPRPEWLGELVEALASAGDDVAAVSGRIVDWAGKRLDFARGVLTFDGHAFQQDYGRPLAEVEIPAAGSELLFACGGNMIVRRRSFLEAGGFDEGYFAYLEDVDLGWRLWAGGQRVLFAPSAVVHHRSMATSQQLGNENRGFLFERNAFMTAYKNYETDLWRQLAPAILLTLAHRTQTLMVQNNPGGEQLTVNPYAGHIANTSSPATREADQAPPPDPPSPIETTLAQKWRGYGPREFTRRGVRKAARMLLPGWLWDEPGGVQAMPTHGDDVAGGLEPRHDNAGVRMPRDPLLSDPRTLAQLRAVSHLLGNLDGAAELRRRVQARRRRSDREIFERFPLYVVPTYPGDAELFSSPAFEAWLPDDLTLVRAELEQVMQPQ